MLSRDDMMLIAAQLIKDRDMLIQEHQALAMRMGGSVEAQTYVYENFLGKYVDELDRIIAKIYEEIHERESKNN